MNKENFNEIIFNIIGQSGQAKALFLEALNVAEKNEFENAQSFLKEGKNALTSLHKQHFELLTQEAKGQNLELSLLLIHAEDQFMSAETTLLLVEKLIIMYQKINDMK